MTNQNSEYLDKCYDSCSYNYDNIQMYFMFIQRETFREGRVYKQIYLHNRLGHTKFLIVLGFNFSFKTYFCFKIYLPIRKKDSNFSMCFIHTSTLEHFLLVLFSQKIIQMLKRLFLTLFYV